MGEDNEKVEILKENDEPGKFFGILASSAKLFLANKVALVIVAILIAIGLTVLVAKKKPEFLGIQGQSIADSQEEIEKLVKEIEKIIALPEGEIPTVATVTEIDKLSGQKFFEKAEKDDKVLVYSQAKKAFLYRPSEKKIIEVGVVNIPSVTPEVAGDEDNSQVSVSPNPSEIPNPTQIPTQIPSPTSIPRATSIPTIQISPESSQ